MLARVQSRALQNANTSSQCPALRPYTAIYTRYYSISSEPNLKATLREVIPAKRELLKKIRTEHGSKVLGEVKVENTIGGMRYENTTFSKSWLRRCLRIH